MRSLSILILTTFILSANSCKKPEPETKGDLTINFKASFDSNPLVVFTDYQTPDADNIQIHVLNFFLSHVEIVKSNDEIIRLKDIAFIDFNGNTDTDKANAGISLSFEDLDPADFKEIRFGIGVEPVQNAKEPGDYPTDPYLGDGGNYWTAWNSYIFSRIEGRLDTLPGAAGGDISFLYHSGVDGMYQHRNFSKNFSISAGQNTTLQFNMDVKDVLYRSGAKIDIPNANVSHSGAVGTEAYDLVKQVITNMADALTLQ